MTIKFGIELELFFIGTIGRVTVPPTTVHRFDRDGCGAIVELRSKPAENLFDVVGEVVGKQMKFEHEHGLLACTSEGKNRHKFTPDEWHSILPLQQKDYSTIPQNIYGHKPRLLPRATAAVSVQLNISDQLSTASTREIELRGGRRETISRPATYGLLDIPRIVRALDKEFTKQIRDSGRQPGWYAIKDSGTRLEYRSLPAFALSYGLFAPRVLTCLKGIIT